MALVVLADLNGDHYLGLQEGEILVNTPANTYIFPTNFPSAVNPLTDVVMSQAEADLFVQVNDGYLRAMQVNGVARFTPLQASIIAYHRLLAVKHGLVSPQFLPQNFFVDYTEAFIADNAFIAAFPLDTINVISARLTAQIQLDISKTFVDRVALVAFVFRARGHHYMSQYEELYNRVWGKCRYQNEVLHISFQHMATVALHAIFPNILDNFWINEVNAMHVNGSLAKRVDVAPAGSAGPYVLKQGVEDLAMIAPGIRDRLQEALHYLDEILTKLAQHRFAGSVNARYYGANKVPFDEKRLSSIAATVLAAINNLTDDAPLGKSPALQRIANNAPITGSVLGRAIGNISQRPEVVNALLVEYQPQ